jgi:hypothetical protein
MGTSFRVPRSERRRPPGAGQEVVERLVNLLAAEPLLHLRIHLERRPRILVTHLPHHVRERSSRRDQQADVRTPQRVRTDRRKPR